MDGGDASLLNYIISQQDVSLMTLFDTNETLESASESETVDAKEYLGNICNGQYSKGGMGT